MTAATLFDLPEIRRERKTRVFKPKTTHRPSWPLDAGLNVVLFAAMGGSCDGLEAAGLPVHIAINHDPVAVAVHQHRHPHTRHFQSDVRDVCPREATRSRTVNVLWASPDCRHFSRAKGGAPVSKAVRSLPWIICRWAGTVRPKVILLENVRELRTWGPLVARRDKTSGRVLKRVVVPDPKRRGKTKEIEVVAEKGERVPLEKQFLVPDPKRKGRTYQALVEHLRSLGYAYEDRDLCCADYGVPTTRTRLFGVARCDGELIRWPERTHAPIGHIDVAAGKLKPWVPAASIIDWSVPMKTIFDRPKPLAPATLRRTARGVIRYVIKNPRPFLIPVTHQGDERVYDLAQPLPTVTRAHRGEIGVVSPHISLHRGDSAGVGIDQPMPTLTANSFHKRPGGCMPLGVVGAALTPFYGAKNAGEARGQKPDDGPLPTLSVGNRFASVAAFLEEHRSTGHDVDTPLPTVTAGDHHAVVASWLVKNYTGVVGSDLNAPIDTITSVDHHSIAAAHLVKLRGTCADGQTMDKPLPAITAGGNHAALVAAFLSHYYGCGGQDQPAGEPLHSVTTKARHALVTVEIDGITFTLSDILFRMLCWYEAAAAHGFARDCIPDEVVIGGKVKKLSQDRKMGFVGNSVPPLIARLLAEANAVHTLYAPERQRVAAEG